MWLVVSGVLAMRHEAAVGHVRDRAGAYIHAGAVVGHRAASNSHVHADHHPGGDTGDCALLTAFHQAVSGHVTSPPALTAARAIRVQACPDAATFAVAVAIYRLAPKTSPPVAA
jgi:hypothetical protein